MAPAVAPSGPTSKRPADSDFYQQRLKAWQPILTPQWVIITFLLIGIPFVIIGFVLKSASDNVVQYKIQYDGAGATGPVACQLPANVPGANSTCTLTLTTEKEMKAPVYVYYELDNFYQNHRRYVKSRSDPQLAGTIFTNEKDLSDCDPLRSRDGKILHPCGLVANSFFNDTFTLATNGLSMSETGIAWDTDVKSKFKPISAADQAAHPNIQFINTTYPGIGNVDNEHFIVWMRPAALPNFRKLYGRIETTIPAGTVLTFNVKAQYPVAGFEGKKSLVVSTTSWMGGQNPFLGIAYIVVGFLAIAMAGLFAARQVMGGRKLGDTSFLVYQNRN